MKRVLRAIEVLAWVGFFAVAGTLLAVRFWLLPNIERYREDIVAAVSRTVGQPVRIGRIEAGWLGIRPQVSLLDVRILDPQGREALVLPVVENSLAWRSLVLGGLHLHSLVIDSPRLAIARDAQGELHVAGMKIPRKADPGAQGGLVDWVLAQPEIVIRNAEVEWRDEKRGAPPLALSALNFRIRNTLWDHSAGLTARVPAELGTALELRATLSGRSLADRAAWRGRVYAETGYTDLAGWRPWIDYPVELSQGRGAARVWVTLERGAPAEATADLHLADLVPDMQPLDVRLTWKAAGASTPARGTLATRQADLESLVRVSQAFPVPEAARLRIAEAAPRGMLHDLKLDWEGAPGAPASVSGRARFSGLAMNAVDKLPGFSGLAGSIEGSEAGGTLSIDARNAELLLPHVLPEPRLAFDALAAQVTWESRRTGDSMPFSVKVGSLSFSNADLAGRASGSYANPGFGSGAIDLTAEVERADITKGGQYLPKGEFIGDATRAFLVTAIKAGAAHDGHFRVRGELSDFPFVDPAKGEFRIGARIEGGVLELGAGWPVIRDIGLQLVFERDRMALTSAGATSVGARLSDVQVQIPDMLVRPASLVATGRAEGTLNEFLRYVAQSPVRRALGGFTDEMSASGRGKLGLKVEMPLGDLERARVAGAFSFTASRFVTHPQIPPIEQASGAFDFTESTIAIREGRGRLLGGPLSVSGGSRTGAGFEVVARGDAAIAALRPLADPAWLRHFSGAAPYTATIALGEGRSRMVIQSSLRGVASVLPPPLAKDASEALPVRVDIVPAEGGRDRVSVRVGSVVLAELLRKREGEAMAVQRAAVWLSPQPNQQARVPERPEVLVYGSLPALDADRWSGLFSKDVVDGNPAPAKSAVPDLPVSLDLAIGALDVNGRRLSELALRGTVDGAGWKANVKSVELAGDIGYRKEGGGHLTARLSHLTMPGDAPGAPAARAAQASREFPAVDLVAERFTVKGRELGRLEIAAAREGTNWRIDKLGVANPDGVLTGKGLWRTGPQSYTALRLDLDASNAGHLLARLGYPDVVRDAPTKMQASVSWDGDPVTIDYPSLSGELQLQAEDGQFLEVDPGIGKLLSIMSLQQLPKRLTLDFRDVFSKGFQFDRIRAAAHVDKGLMTLKDFDMRGSAADVDMSGEVDLAKETQALRVRVVPQLGDTASTALLFVNPFLFFPAAIAQRILKDPLGHIFAFNYSVSGSWTDPKVERTRVDAQPVPEGSAQ